MRIGRTGEAAPEPDLDVAQGVIEWEGWDDFRLPPIVTVTLIILATIIFAIAAAVLIYMLMNVLLNPGLEETGTLGPAFGGWAPWKIA